ncbi:carboxylesterase family protein [Actinomyces sp.]|uniref:carboxylesterase/lipase family protein n=1 Tax=Actinomyces sp. TaxID=29317 RepID=UPI002912B954|nr:carboxylesterase family protein [Actinomyces sp.]MDU5568722.1 carboxylesterase family protein [Actinomyces sp.]
MHSVQTVYGKVAGSPHPLDENVYRFLGIPYAAAPVGDLYLQAPAPHPGWDGVRDCTALPPTPQKRPYSADAILIDPSIAGDEILNLNIFTPKNARNLPVLVWIHGGGFKSGVAASPITDGRKFAARGVVVVSISYRLGFEGFGWLKDAVPNRGFLDQQAALKWVRENISAFGGDPSRVTIAGQSAGGGSVLAHLTAPSSQAFFDRAISESGVLPPMSEAMAQDRTKLVTDYLGVEPTIAGITSAKDRLVEAEIEAERRIYEQWPGAAQFVAARLAGKPMSDLPFTPWQEETVLPYTIDEGVDRGVGADKPLLLTVTSEEFTDILAPMASELNPLNATDVLVEGGLEDARNYLREHPRANTTSLIMGQLVSDAIFVWPAQSILQRRKETGAAHTALYLFDWCPALDDPSVDQVQQWSRHCIDMAFAFDLLEEPTATPLVGTTPRQNLADDFHGQWLAFIKGKDVPGTSD